MEQLLEVLIGVSDFFQGLSSETGKEDGWDTDLCYDLVIR